MAGPSTPTAPLGGRIELGDGDWAEVTAKPTHGQVNRLYKAWTASQDDQSLYVDMMAEAILALTTGWSIRLPSGESATLDRSGLDNVPWDKLRPIFEAAMAVFGKTQTGAADPNA